MEHTPIPWMAYGTGVITGNDIGPIDARTREDAAYIVQAVNNHEELVAALQDLCTLWTNWAKDSQFLTEPLRRSLHMRVDEAGTILQRIEKGE